MKYAKKAGNLVRTNYIIQKNWELTRPEEKYFNKNSYFINKFIVLLLLFIYYCFII